MHMFIVASLTLTYISPGMERRWNVKMCKWAMTQSLVVES